MWSYRSSESLKVCLVPNLSISRQFMSITFCRKHHRLTKLCPLLCKILFLCPVSSINNCHSFFIFSSCFLQIIVSEPPLIPAPRMVKMTAKWLLADMKFLQLPSWLQSKQNWDLSACQKKKNQATKSPIIWICKGTCWTWFTHFGEGEEDLIKESQSCGAVTDAFTWS